MAKQQQEKLSIYERLKQFLEEVRAEMNKVSWPSKEEIKSSTSIVMMLVGLLGLIIGAMDVVFQAFVLC